MTASPAGPDGATAATGRPGGGAGCTPGRFPAAEPPEAGRSGNDTKSEPLGDARRTRQGQYPEDSARPERDDPVEISAPEFRSEHPGHG